jgi:hypothetical protein
VDLREGRRKYIGYAVLLVAGLASFGVLPHSPRFQLSDGKPGWDQLRNPPGRATAFERRLGEVASGIAGRDVSVRCDDLSWLSDSTEPGGAVQFSGDRPANYARIRYDMCTKLGRLSRDHGAGGFAEAQAVEVLAHESFHLRGVKNEAAAECYALQFVARVARQLGATATNAEELYAFALEGYPRHPTQYLSRDCRPGGALDLDGGFPAS